MKRLAQSAKAGHGFSQTVFRLKLLTPSPAVIFRFASAAFSLSQRSAGHEAGEKARSAEAGGRRRAAARSAKLPGLPVCQESLSSEDITSSLQRRGSSKLAVCFWPRISEKGMVDGIHVRKLSLNVLLRGQDTYILICPPPPFPGFLLSGNRNTLEFNHFNYVFLTFDRISFSAFWGFCGASY